MFFKDKKIVVTGGGGMIGTHYIKELLNRGAKVRTHTHNRPLNVVDDRIDVLENIDLEKFDDCMELVGDADYVMHAAGKICHPSEVPTDFRTALNQVTLVSNLLESSYKCGVKRFVDINSSTGYPNREHPIKEDEYWDDEPYISYYGYGWSRRYREKMMEHLSHFSDMKILVCRGTAMFGPHDNFDIKTCHVIPALINRVLKDELVLEKGESMKPYNLGYGSTITIGEIVDTILKVTGKNPKIEWDNTKPTTIPFRSFNTDRISMELGFKPKYTFEQGIKETVNWYKEHFNA